MRTLCRVVIITSVLWGIGLLATSPAEAKSCEGFYACSDNTGEIGEDAYVGEKACQYNEASIGKDACIGEQACFGNTGKIGAGACVGDRACLGNSQDRGAGECVGKPDSGAGICEQAS